MKYLSFFLRPNKNRSSSFILTFCTTLLFVFLCITQLVSATCYVCLVNGQCGEVSGYCSFYNQCPCTVSCENCTKTYFNPNTDYIYQENNGEAWIVKENKKIRILGDKFESFLFTMKEKYTKVKIGDRQIQKQLNSELIAFSKTADYNVSKRLLDKISFETGLKIKDNSKIISK